MFSDDPAPLRLGHEGHGREQREQHDEQLEAALVEDARQRVARRPQMPWHGPPP